jgi:hypothetical protein
MKILVCYDIPYVYETTEVCKTGCIGGHVIAEVEKLTEQSLLGISDDVVKEAKKEYPYAQFTKAVFRSVCKLDDE